MGNAKRSFVPIEPRHHKQIGHHADGTYQARHPQREHFLPALHLHAGPFRSWKIECGAEQAFDHQIHLVVHGL